MRYTSFQQICTQTFPSSSTSISFLYRFNIYDLAPPRINITKIPQQPK